MEIYALEARAYFVLCFLRCFHQITLKAATLSSVLDYLITVIAWYFLNIHSDNYA